MRQKPEMDDKQDLRAFFKQEYTKTITLFKNVAI
jgi:hypothetical protein